jgi:phosphoglycerate dehydrogenase-like enzyme
MRVLVWDKVENNEENLPIEFKSLDELLGESDVISLHLQLNEKTRYIINDKTIKKMKNNAFLLNTARGALVDSEDLLKALKAGKFAGVIIFLS